MQWFDSTSGRIGGVAGLVLAALIAGLGVAGALPAAWIGLAALFAWLVWASMLRPRLGVSATALVLRGLVSETTIPLPRVEKYVVQQVFAVWVDGHRYVSPAVGRSRRQLRRPVSAQKGTMHYADAVDDTVRARLRDAAPTDAPVTRTWGWRTIGLGVAAVVLVAVLLAV